MPFDRQRDRRLLERQLLHGIYLEHLAWLRDRCDELRETTTWPDAARRLGTPVPDCALRPILQAVRDEGAAWNPILLLLFWVTLERIYRRTRRRWGEDDGEFWADILAAFSLAVARLDLEQRPERIAHKIFGDTFRATYLTSKRRWHVARHEVLAADEEPDLRLDVEDPDDTRLLDDARDWNCDREFRRRFYLRLLRQRLITPHDYLVLCRTRLLGWTVRTCAARIGLSAAAALKRRQRSEAKILHLDPLFSRFRVPTHPA